MIRIKGNTFGFTAFLIMSISCMILIFMFSVQTAELSSGVSESFYDSFISVTGLDFISHGVFRKIAHFCEFAALGFSVSGTVFFYKNKNSILLSLLLCVIYAVSDEVHQLFVPERAGRIFDIFVDSCGSLTGILVFAFIAFVVNKLLGKIRLHHESC